MKYVEISPLMAAEVLTGGTPEGYETVFSKEWSFHMVNGYMTVVLRNIADDKCYKLKFRRTGEHEVGIPCLMEEVRERVEKIVHWDPVK